MDKNQIKKGMLVNYHSIIGQPPTRIGVEVTSVPWELYSGQWVCKIKGQSGCVSIDALSEYTPPEAAKVDFSKALINFRNISEYISKLSIKSPETDSDKMYNYALAGIILKVYAEQDKYCKACGITPSEVMDGDDQEAG